MRKIFSTVLVATALLFSMQANAGNVAKVGGAEYATFDAALAALGQASGTIELLDNCTQTNSMFIYSNQTVTLNLGSYTLTSNAINNVNLFKGHLIINAKEGGELKNVNSKKDTYYGNVIQVYGSSDPDAKNYSVLDIHGAKITSLKSRGIHVYTVNQTLRTTYGLTAEQVPNVTSCAYGVVINIDGNAVINGDAYGIQITGGINALTGNIPVVTVGSDVTVISGSDKGNAGIYAAGYGKWTIEGTVIGATGIYVKGGDVNIKDANVSSNASTYTTPVFKDGKNTSGVEAGGSAVFVEGSTGSVYPGGGVSVTGDCILYSEYGFALEVQNLAKGENDKIKEVSITGGTLIGSNEEGKGCLNIDPEIKSGVTEIEITGVTLENATEDDKDLVEDILGANGMITPVVTEDGDTKYIVTTLPTGTTWLTDINDPNLTTTSFVKYEGTLVQPQVVDMNGSKTFAYLKVANATTIKVGDGEVLKVDEIILGENAVIDVAPTGKFLVTGASGIIAFSTSNLVLHASADGQATFALNPAVKSNRSPKATVEYYSVAGMSGTDEYVTGISCPFAVLDTIYMADGSVSSSYAFWKVDLTQKKWVNFASRDDLKNMEAFQMVLSRPASTVETPATYVWKGQLQGNNSGVLNLRKGFNYIGNAYMAEMKASEMIDVLQKSGAKVRTLVYTWNMGNGGYDIHTGNLSSLSVLKPMEAFLLYADEACTINLNYTKLIWNNVNK